MSKLLFLFLILSNSVLAWRTGQPLTEPNKYEIICNNDLVKVIEKKDKKYCFKPFLEDKEWCFEERDEASTAVCRAFGTQ
ncbi:MAG: hypothetical protein ACTSUM_00690 [Alphaproteobacteria bacterium]|nr:MAG: hypothetical protein B6I23_00150 [Rickettsiaceae bacterium 4572_127]